MTETELNQILQRLERLEAEVRQLAEAVRQLKTAGTEDTRQSSPAGEMLREPAETYSADKKTIPTAHPHVVRIPGVQGGEPIIRGAYKTVRGIVELTFQGRTPAQILEDKGEPLTLAQVYDALSYYYDNREEMDEIIARHKAALEEIIQISREQQAEYARRAQQQHDVR